MVEFGEGDAEVRGGFLDCEVIQQERILDARLGGDVTEWEPAVLGVIVELAFTQDFSKVGEGEWRDNDIRGIGVLHCDLCVGEVVEGDARIDVVSGVIHDVVQNHSDRPGEFDVNGTFDLAIEEAPLVDVIKPTNFRVSMVEQDYESHELVPQKLREDDCEQYGEPDRGLKLICHHDGHGDLGNDEECD